MNIGVMNHPARNPLEEIEWRKAKAPEQKTAK
jgi:hypothetical protein